MQHSAPVNAVAVTPDGTRIVSAGDDGDILVWDRATRDLVSTLTGHTTRVTSLAVTHDQVISASSGGTVRRWDLATGQQVGDVLGGYIGGISAVAVTPDGTQIIAGYRDDDGAGKLVIWDRATGTQLGEPLTGGAGDINALAITPDGAQVIAATDGAITCWDLASRQPAPLSIPLGPWVRAVVSPDGYLIISVSADGVIRLWDRNTGERVGTPMLGHNGPIMSLAVTRDGSQIISAGADGTIRIWNTRTCQQLGEFVTGSTGPVNAVALTPDDAEIVSAGGDGIVQVWQRPSGMRIGPGHVGALTPDGRVLIAPGDGNVLRFWEWTTGQQLPAALKGHTGVVQALVVTPDGSQIISGGNDQTIRVWDRYTGEQVAVWTGHTRPIGALVVTPDGAKVVSGSVDETVRIWDRASGAQLRKLTGHDGAIGALAVTPDGERIVSGGFDGTVRVWDRVTGRQVQELGGDIDSVYALAITSTGSHLVTGGVDGIVRVWDRVTGRQVQELSGHTDSVHALAVTPAGQIVSGSADTTVRVWDWATGQQIGDPLVGHTDLVEWLALAPDGGRIISSSRDGTVRIWNYPKIRGLQLAEVVSDLESSEDRLGIAGDVRMIAEVVAALSTKPPLSIALLGDWGMGKSSLMRQVQDRVEELASRSRGGGSAFASNVRQVRFNAWHYSDDHLWVGLVEHLFHELAQPDAKPTGEIHELEVRLAARQAEKERLESDLRAVSTQRGWFGRMLLPLRSARVAWAALRGIWQELRAGGWRLLLALAVIAAGVVLVVLGFPWLGGVIALFGPVAAAWRRLAEYTEQVRKELLARRSEVDEDIIEVEKELTQLDPARRLNALLAEISAPDRYASYRGLTGRIHQDLRRLSEDLAAARDAGAVQRIVLYVDDLDRCTPKRVVDVLQAVNLLLTMDLFVVVIAVDPRWLLRSLSRHHEGLFDDNEVAYLDKIFHIPVALRPMGDRAVGYLRSLLPADEESIAEPVTQRATQQQVPEAPVPPQVQATSAPPSVTPAPQWRALPVDLNPVGLKLSKTEADFLARLTPLLSTPRAIKKLVNLYRLLRLGVPEARLEEFTKGPFQAAALLLAALVGAPQRARALLEALASGAPDEDIKELTAGTPLGELMETGQGDIATYRTWAKTVARYGFTTYDLFGG